TVSAPFMYINEVSSEVPGKSENKLAARQCIRTLGSMTTFAMGVIHDQSGRQRTTGTHPVLLTRSLRTDRHPRQLRSIEGEIPNSLASRLNGRPLLTSRATASRLNSSVK